MGIGQIEHRESIGEQKTKIQAIRLAATADSSVLYVLH
jgi:hypothetical protein